MLYHTPNRPYDLSTEHGRAQSVSHSPHGAMLADTVEQCLDSAKENLCEKVEALVDKELERIDEVPGDLCGEFAVFLNDLGKRDAEVFRPMLAEYVAERKTFIDNAIILQGLMEQLKTLIGVEEDGE